MFVLNCTCERNIEDPKFFWNREDAVNEMIYDAKDIVLNGKPVFALDNSFAFGQSANHGDCDWSIHEVDLADVITSEQVEKAKQVLVDNGIDEDEAETVLQAIGYALIDTELFKSSVASDDSDVTVLYDVDSETPMSIRNNKLRVDWYNADEGFNGDYDPEDPKDENLLRFDVYYRPKYCADPDDGWCEVKDASYCTQMPANAPRDILERALRRIFEEYRDVIDDYPEASVKKLGERLSWVSEDDFKDIE